MSIKAHSDIFLVVAKCDVAKCAPQVVFNKKQKNLSNLIFEAPESDHTNYEFIQSFQSKINYFVPNGFFLWMIGFYWTEILNCP